MNIKILSVSLIILCTLLLSACDLQPANQTPEVYNQGEIQTAYPNNRENEEEKDISTSYPPPFSTMTNNEINSLQVDDPILSDNTKGSVSGLIINNIQQRPLGSTDIYLTKGIGPEGSSLPAILAGSLTNRDDISGITSDNGVFTFNDIAPGNYFLIVSMDLSPIYLSNNDTAPLLISIEAGKIINLGIVYYTGK